MRLELPPEARIRDQRLPEVLVFPEKLRIHTRVASLTLNFWDPLVPEVPRSPRFVAHPPFPHNSTRSPQKFSISAARAVRRTRGARQMHHPQLRLPARSAQPIRVNALLLASTLQR